MNSTSPLGLLGICVAFAVTAFLGGMAGSLLLGGKSDNAGASPPLAQATAVGARPGSAVAPGLIGTGGSAGISGAGAAAVAPTLPPPPPATATPAPPTATSAPTTYTVVAGDNPTIIAGKLKVPQAEQTAWIQSFLSLNAVTANQLAVGKAYKLPPNTPGGAPAAPAATTPAAGAPAATATKTP